MHRTHSGRSSKKPYTVQRQRVKRQHSQLTTRTAHYRSNLPGPRAVKRAPPSAAASPCSECKVNLLAWVEHGDAFKHDILGRLGLCLFRLCSCQIGELHQAVVGRSCPAEYEAAKYVVANPLHKNLKRRIASRVRGAGVGAGAEQAETDRPFCAGVWSNNN